LPPEDFHVACSLQQLDNPTSVPGVSGVDCDVTSDQALVDFQEVHCSDHPLRLADDRGDAAQCTGQVGIADATIGGQFSKDCLVKLIGIKTE